MKVRKTRLEEPTHGGSDVVFDGMITLESFLMNPWLHYVIVLIHICAGLFWLGWMVFIFLLLSPVLKEIVPGHVRTVLPRLKSRVRRVVFWLIILIVLTGLHNVYYTGLYRWTILLGTDYGQRFLVKLAAASLLFSIYALAPYLTNSDKTGATLSNSSDHEKPSQRMMIVLHLVAFFSGLTAALIGISLGG